MNKSKFSLLILLVMILSISAVAAADDTSDIAVQAVDDDAVMDVALQAGGSFGEIAGNLIIP